MGLPLLCKVYAGLSNISVSKPPIPNYQHSPYHGYVSDGYINPDNTHSIFEAVLKGK